MSRLQRFMTWLTEPLEERQLVYPPELDPNSYYPDIDAQLYARQRAQAGDIPTVTVREALGIPAVFRAVNLLSTVAASFNLREYINQREVDPAPVVLRPQRAWKPQDFTRDTVQHMASYGEAIWLILARDFEGRASDILPVPPYLLKSEWDGIRHRWYTENASGKTYLNSDDVIHIPFMRDPGSGRGVGPLQLCGVAFNVAVEADRWASRFFLGSVPSIYLSSDVPINAEEAARIKEQWLADPPNIPKVGHGFKPEKMAIDAESAQIVASRMHNKGEVATAFGIPGKLLEYNASGSSLNYQNVGELGTELVRLTLAPSYLEPVEQSFSDLRPRGHEVRYDVSGFERADPETRYKNHKIAIEAGIYTADYAAELEGIQGQSPEVVPIPLRRAG